MALISDDATSRLAFSLAENKGVYAVLIGSGLSRSAKIPTGWENTLDLVRRAAEARGIGPQPDWAAWYRATENVEPNYSTLLAELATTAAERRALIQAYVEPTAQEHENGEKIPTAAHKALAQLVKSGHVRVVITTNFDRLMENALREIGIEPTVISSEDALSGAEPLIHARCYVLKLHGDYKDTRILNTEDELNRYPDAVNTLLHRLFDEFGLIVAGWSGVWDEALRTAILRAGGRRYTTFWLTQGAPAERAAALIAHRSAILVKGTNADGFFTQLKNKVHTIAESRLESPQSIELLVGMVKGFLGKPEHLIQLDELIAQETKRLTENLEVLMADMPAKPVSHLITTCEQLVEGLARVATVLGRWGKDIDHSLMLEVIKALLSFAQQSSASDLTLNKMRMYPAFLIFNAYGAGLSRAGRWETMNKLVNYSLVLRSSPTRVAGALFWTLAFEASTKSVWKNLAGYEQFSSPLSQRVCVLVSQWADSFLGAAHNAKVQFARFELCCALNQTRWDSARRSNLFQHGADKVVVGVLAEDREVFEEIRNELVGGESTPAFLKAGFKTMDEVFLDRLFRNIQSHFQPS
ncbi:SIR2 family protein [Pseudomonas sp. BGI-2]|uniref:SIR2 family protein n=1 Tax=Pseudomonas sp. BGI-2 TaxID=2528211 RepID=UPI001034F5EB|nr:SIR2 family protein [Pseudomonas sp. BGI-2]TBN36134.1 hypothetical protein EYC95_24885 [Pseudomonas sp. BGI-2]